MAQTTTILKSTPDNAPRRKKKQRLLPKILIGAAVLLVAVIGAGALYAATIDRSLTSIEASNCRRTNRPPPVPPKRRRLPAR